MQSNKEINLIKPKRIAMNIENKNVMTDKVTVPVAKVTNTDLVKVITEAKDELRGLALDEIEKLATKLVKSGFTPLSSDAILTPAEYKEASGAKRKLHDIEVAKAVAIGKRAQELQIPLMAAFNNLHALSTQGGLTVTAGYHIINALLRRAGCIVRFVKRYEPITKWLSAGGYLYDEIPFIKDDKGGERQLKIGTFPRDFTGKQVIVDSENKIRIMGGEIAAYEYDWITTVEIERSIPQPDGTYKTEIQTASYTYLEDAAVIAANYKGKPPHNRLSYPKTIYEKTAFAKAARWIGDDLLLGVMETGEFLDSQGIDYDLDGRGEVTIIDKNGNALQSTD